MVGSASKMGKRYPVRAYRFSNEHYTIEELVSWIPKLKEWDEYRIDMTERDTVPKATAKKSCGQTGMNIVSTKENQASGILNVIYMTGGKVRLLRGNLWTSVLLFDVPSHFLP